MLRRRRARRPRGQRRGPVAGDHLGGLRAGHRAFAAQPPGGGVGLRADALDALQQVARHLLVPAASLRGQRRQRGQHRRQLVERQVVRHHFLPARRAHRAVSQQGGHCLRFRPGAGRAQLRRQFGRHPGVGGVGVLGQIEHVTGVDDRGASGIHRHFAGVGQTDGLGVSAAAVDAPRDFPQRVAGHHGAGGRPGHGRPCQLRPGGRGRDQRRPGQVGRAPAAAHAVGQFVGMALGAGAIGRAAGAPALQHMGGFMRGHAQTGPFGETHPATLGGCFGTERAHSRVDRRRRRKPGHAEGACDGGLVRKIGQRSGATRCAARATAAAGTARGLRLKDVGRGLGLGGAWLVRLAWQRSGRSRSRSRSHIRGPRLSKGGSGRF